MPYIEQDKRNRYDDLLDPLQAELSHGETTAGALNYLLTQIALGWFDCKVPTYARMAEVVAAFECAKLEFYRRVVAPYEDDKKRGNGDVY